MTKTASGHVYLLNPCYADLYICNPIDYRKHDALLNFQNKQYI